MTRVRGLATSFFALESEKKCAIRAGRYGANGYNARGAERVGAASALSSDTNSTAMHDAVESLYFTGWASRMEAEIQNRLSSSSRELRE